MARPPHRRARRRAADHGTHLVYELLDVAGPRKGARVDGPAAPRWVRCGRHGAHPLRLSRSLATMFLTWAARRRETEIRFIGERGSITWSGGTLTLERDGTGPAESFDHSAELDKASYAKWFADLFCDFATTLDSGDGAPHIAISRRSRLSWKTPTAARRSRARARHDRKWHAGLFVLAPRVRVSGRADRLGQLASDAGPHRVDVRAHRPAVTRSSTRAARWPGSSRWRPIAAAFVLAHVRGDHCGGCAQFPHTGHQRGRRAISRGRHGADTRQAACGGLRDPAQDAAFVCLRARVADRDRVGVRPAAARHVDRGVC